MGIADEMKKAREADPAVVADPVNTDVPQNEELYEETAGELGEFALKLFPTDYKDPYLLRIMAPQVLTVEPSFSAQLEPKLPPNISKPVLHRILRSIDPHLLETDMADCGEPITPYELMGMIPGSAYVSDALKTQQVARENGAVNYTTGHPFVFAYASAPEHRPLIAAAISRAMRDEVTVPNTTFAKNNAKLAVVAAAPSMQYLVKVSKEYGLKNLKDAGVEVNRVIKLFMDKW